MTSTPDSNKSSVTKHAPKCDPLMELLLCTDATKGFAECLCHGTKFDCSLHLRNKDEWNKDIPLPLWPSCSLLHMEEEVKTDGKLKGAHLYHVTLFEEDHTFYAVANSGLHQKLFSSGHPAIGSTISIIQHSIIHGSLRTGQPNLCVLVHDMVFRAAPTLNDLEEAKDLVRMEGRQAHLITQCEDVHRARFDHSFVVNLRCTGGVACVSSKMHPKCGYYYYTMPDHPSLAVTSCRTEKKACDCLSIWNHTACICEDVPCKSVNKEASLCSLADNCKITVDSTEWEDCSNACKRISLCWFYACHVFSFCGEESKELPTCLRDHIRTSYPSHSGKCVGHKSTEARRNAKQNRSLEEMDVNSKKYKK